MNHTLPLPAPARRVRRIVLVGLAIAGVVIAAPGVRRLFVAAAPPVTALGVADGVVPDGAPVSVWDDEVPAVGKLDADLLDALRRAAKAAEADGVPLRVNSGWRSPEYQEELLRRAVARHGSLEKAARWVATPETSPHVAGEAVDIGPARAAAWLSAHGAAYGLCQIYRNEPWHYELRPDAVRRGCPPMYPDPSKDPRMRR
ncbi:M15 family metallopeptidase [Amycolatopsis thermoflava]|uniref:M15 family metallopeptidase n=1 Tax=Amycolatopsis thermoflava TaxID=84480 RepID=UPI003EB76D62